MGDVLINEVEAQVFRKENTEADFRFLVKEYPYYPTVWVAYANYCHTVLKDVDKAKQILGSVRPTLRALEIWVCLLELEVSTTNDNLAKYSILKSAVEDVGWDPRSLPLWDSFFALFVSLHNQAVKALAVTHNQLSANNVTVQAVSSTAPLASLEAATKSFHERQALDDDISRFFTTVDTADLLTSKTQAVKEALLRHPLRHEQVLDDPSAVVNEHKLRELSAKGDLNLEVFHQYLRRFALTPFLNPPGGLWRLVGGVLPDTMRSQLDPYVLNIQRLLPIIFQGMSSSMFCRPSSPLTPELDMSMLGYWESLLTKEAQDCWGIKQVDEALWKSRMEFLYNTGCRNLRYLPTLWFERAQFQFKQGLVNEGISILETISHEVAMLGECLPIILADAWEVIAQDLERSVGVLHSAIAHVNQMEKPASISSLIYFTLLKNARLKGLRSWSASVKALLIDTELTDKLTEDFYCALISFAVYNDESPGLISDLIQKGLQHHPLSVALRLLLTMPLTSLPKAPDYEAALLSLSNLEGDIQVMPEVLTLVKRACRHVHLFGISTHEVKKWFNHLKQLSSLEPSSTYNILETGGSIALHHLYTSDYFETYRHYETACLNLGGVGLGAYFCPSPSNHRVIMPPGSFSAEQVALVVRGSQKTKQLLDLLETLAPTAERELLDDSGSAADKTAALQKVFIRSVERARGRKLFNQQQSDQLRTILEDPALTRSLQRWFETTS